MHPININSTRWHLEEGQRILRALDVGVEETLGQENPSLQRTTLTGVDHRGEHAYPCNVLFGHVVEDDRGALAAELQLQSLHRAAAVWRLGHDATAE